MAIQVTGVDAGSPAEQAGIRQGDTLLRADQNELNDMLDYEFYTAGSSFCLTLCRQGQQHSLPVEKAEYQPLGCSFATYLADQKHSCSNHCMFCFIDQLPPGLRDTLYFKDDDERLSFLYGNYITLTNMTPHEIDRIVRMHISPINISVHTTDPQLRVRMLANKRGSEILQHMRTFAAAGIEMNCQLVLCRGINDGDALRRTLDDLIELAPQVASIAAVPAGLTDYRKGLFRLTAYDRASAAETLDILEEYGRRCLEQLGTRLVFPGDEWYLAAERPIPPDAFYEEYAQLENGVGMWRQYHDDFARELAQPHGLVLPRRMDLVTGQLVAPLIQASVDALHRRYPQVRITVHPIQNRFFGGNVTVAGLVTGTDITAQCRGKLKSRVLGVPEVMLRDEKDLFLDDYTLPRLAQELGVRVQVLPNGGRDSCRAMLGKQ